MTKKQIIRKKFSEDVFKRDNNKCVFCNETENLDAHHITDRSNMPYGGYVKENGITLCEKHHLDAERYHSSEHIFWVKDMHPNDLYEKIGSSFFEAVKSSVRLEFKN